MFWIMPLCRAVFTPKVNQLDVQAVPPLFWKETTEISLDDVDILRACQPPSVSQPFDVSIDCECRDIKDLGEDYIRCFSSNSWECYELLSGVRDFSVMQLNQLSG